MLPLENRTHLTAPTSALLAGLPSIVDLAQCKDVNDTFSDLRAWIRRTSSQAGLSAAGQLLSFEQREAVLNFLERLTLDPLRKNLARELLVKLNMDEIWRSGSVHGRRITEGVPQELRGTLAPGRSASVSAARMSSDPIRHRLAEDLTEKLASPTDSAILRSSITFPRAHHTVGMCRLGMHNDPITVLFCVPRTCHHVVVGKHGEDVGKLEEKHAERGYCSVWPSRFCGTVPPNSRVIAPIASRDRTITSNGVRRSTCIIRFDYRGTRCNAACNHVELEGASGGSKS